MVSLSLIITESHNSNIFTKQTSPIQNESDIYCVTSGLITNTALNEELADIILSSAQKYNIPLKEMLDDTHFVFNKETAILSILSQALTEMPIYIESELQEGLTDRISHHKNARIANFRLFGPKSVTDISKELETRENYFASYVKPDTVNKFISMTKKDTPKKMASILNKATTELFNAIGNIGNNIYETTPELTKQNLTTLMEDITDISSYLHNKKGKYKFKPEAVMNTILTKPIPRSKTESFNGVYNSKSIQNIVRRIKDDGYENIQLSYNPSKASNMKASAIVSSLLNNALTIYMNTLTTITPRYKNLMDIIEKQNNIEGYQGLIIIPNNANSDQTANFLNRMKSSLKEFKNNPTPYEVAQMQIYQQSQNRSQIDKEGFDFLQKRYCNKKGL